MSRFSLVFNLAIGPVLNLAYSAQSGGESASFTWNPPTDSGDLSGYQKLNDINSLLLLEGQKILSIVEIREARVSCIKIYRNRPPKLGGRFKILAERMRKRKTRSEKDDIIEKLERNLEIAKKR